MTKHAFQLQMLAWVDVPTGLLRTYKGCLPLFRVQDLSCVLPEGQVQPRACGIFQAAGPCILLHLAKHIHTMP